MENTKYAKMQNAFLSQAKFSTNDSQLNYLRKKMLANFYERQIRQKKQDQNTSKRYSSVNTAKTTSQNPQSSRVTTFKEKNFYDINQMQIDRQRAMKLQLAKQYQHEMMRKSEQRKIKQQKRKRESQIMIQSLKHMRDLQNQKSKRYHEINKNNMQQHLYIMEKQKTQKAEQKKMDQQEFNRKYNMNRNHSQGSLNNAGKQLQFKQHYQNVDHAQNQIQKLYLSKWSPLIQKRQQQKQKLIEAGIFRNKQFIDIKQIQKTNNDQKMLDNLKHTLEEQFANQLKRKQQRKLQRRNDQYTTKNFLNVYHPICNPVDFKINHENKYILKQLREEKNYQDRLTGSTNQTQMTTLARNGSFSLLSK